MSVSGNSLNSDAPMNLYFHFSAGNSSNGIGPVVGFDALLGNIGYFLAVIMTPF